ncbi:hypothetical protein PSHT_13570 [Puccinia striiformis]|uniref:Uncharacterized protein n=3 Tax=Puccinia striiformis TaxID=27350 RepID=A0A0L0V1E9_9BASI|nr:hypothetical protein H4Q26_014870 [Puccinia striiformis f. sp. tritici PST-130]KNE92844.1 hypothetical protein, variant [Puccinia striiformis f. sp. tritici PST-78]POV99407.1 hypothetical protein PSHT_13570 [Puccinia striiformis]POV99796.1 hypothetical protein PSTT_13591 [Puccinia striiformis]
MNFVILPMIFFLTVIHPKTGLAIDSARLSTTKQIRPGARAAAQLECKPLAGLQALKDKSLYLTLNINPESLIPMNQTIRRSEMLAASMAQKQNDSTAIRTSWVLVKVLISLTYTTWLN